MENKNGLAYISYLELEGFKSFARKTKILFDGKFIAIVGPNGSGKSNILDAIRWVLGETVPSKLRVSRQHELIFGGSPSLEALKSAKVTLGLTDFSDNPKKYVISRVVDINGQSFVFIDEKRKTLGDLLELKRVVGLLNDNYAFIGQGEVSNLIKWKPSERKRHFESLFGIDVIYDKKRSVELKLLEAKESSKRLKTLVTELLRRLEEIEPEVKKAYEYKSLKNKLKEIEKELILEKFAEIYKNKRHYILQIKEIKKAIDEDNCKLKALKEKLCRFNNALSLVYKNIDVTEKKFLEVNGKLLDLRLKIKEQNLILKQNRKQKDVLDKEIDTLAKRKKEIADLLKETTKKFEKVLKEYESLRKEYEKVKEAFSDISFLENEILLLEGKIKRIRGDLDSLSLQKDKVVSQLEKAKQRLDLINKRLDESKDAYRKGFMEKRSMILEYDKATALYDKLSKRAVLLFEKLSEKKKKLKVITSQINDIKDIRFMELVPSSVSRLKSAVLLGKLNVDIKLVSDIIKVPQEYSTAIESFLGGRLFWVVVDTMEDAYECIRFLKKERVGKVTFLPVERCSYRKAKIFDLDKKSGVIGLAISLIDYDRDYEVVVSHLLGDLVILKDYKTAVSLIRSGFKGPFVTVAGEVFLPSGSISGGATPKDGLLVWKAKLNELQGQKLELESEITKLQERWDKIVSEQERVAKEKSAVEKAIDLKSSELKAIKQEVLQLVSEKKKLKESVFLIKNKLNGLRDEIKALESVYKKLLEDLSRKRKKLDDLRNKDNKAVKTQYLNLKNELKSIKEKLNLLKQEQNFIEDKLKKYKVEREGILNNIHQIEAVLNGLIAEYKVLIKRKKSFLEQKKMFSKSLSVLEGFIKTLKPKVSFIENSIEAKKKALLSLENKTSLLDFELNSLKSEAEAKGIVNIDEADIFNKKEDKKLKKLLSEQKRIKRQIELLGEVNIGYITEKEGLKKRINFLEENLSDVETSIDMLEGLIKNLDVEAQRRFLNGVKKINKSFSEMFKRLFGGGEALLEIVDGGVDVKVRPPGKILKSLSQLSGGEQTLTAVALLFSAVKEANLPFVVLDEVDASLDEVNLSKYADFIKGLSSDIQLVVMTHRRKTMEKADLLYGVVMNEPGVSSVIGVDLRQWE